MKRIEEIDDSQESCGTLWHYIVYQTFQTSPVSDWRSKQVGILGIQRHMSTRILTCIPSF